MISKFFPVFILLLATLSQGNALQCLSCVEGLDSDCGRAVNVSTETCSLPFNYPGMEKLNLTGFQNKLPDFPIDADLKVACVETILGAIPPAVLRGCFAELTGAPSVCEIFGQFVPLAKCRTCDTDGCNADTLI